MGVLIEIPSALKEYVNDQDEVEVDGSSVVEALDSLCTQFPEIKSNLFDEEGVVRKFINIYINDDDIRYANGINSRVRDGDSIQIVPSVAGGVLKI